jgi:uncharacterized protein YggE
MNKIKLLPIIVLYSFAFSIQSQVQNNIPSIEVYGTAVIKVVPDIINFSLSIDNKNANILAAKNENDRSLTKVLDILKDRGILEKDIQTEE